MAERYLTGRALSAADNLDIIRPGRLQLPLDPGFRQARARGANSGLPRIANVPEPGDLVLFENANASLWDLIAAVLAGDAKDGPDDLAHVPPELCPFGLVGSAGIVARYFRRFTLRLSLLAIVPADFVAAVRRIGSRAAGRENRGASNEALSGLPRKP